VGRRGQSSGRTAASGLALVLVALAAHAQAPPPATPPARPAPTFPADALIQSFTVPPAAARMRKAEPLPGPLQLRLQRALDLRASGLPDRARDTILVLLREQPHHPLLVTELGRTHAVRQDWGSLERLAVAERTAQRDSALLGAELAGAYERLARPRDAMRIAVAAWAASAVDGPWASAVFFRFAPVDLRLATTLLDGASNPRPWRSDLAIGLARLHAVTGRSADAVRVLVDAERRSGLTGLRQVFSEEALMTGRAADTSAALAVLTNLAADPARRPDERLASGRRAWAAAQASGREAESAPRLAAALREVPGERWGPEFLLSLVRSLQKSGNVSEARALMAASPGLEDRIPELALERALGAVREGDARRALPVLDSLAKAWPPARFMLAEAQFFSGEMDSAHANYARVAERPEDPDAALALDRLYLLEEAPQSPLRTTLGRLAWERWRGARTAALRLADSLWRAQAPRGDYAARAGLELAALKVESGDTRGALVPLLVIADSLADDRLAPLARQRAGDAYASLGDEKNALSQYEECLARYPRAWNSAEVRRRVERLRKEKRL
jgi:TolA-binding protein